MALLKLPHFLIHPPLDHKRRKKGGPGSVYEPELGASTSTETKEEAGIDKEPILLEVWKYTIKNRIKHFHS